MTLPQRQCLILQGDANWLLEQARNYYQPLSEECKLWLSDSEQKPAEAVAIKTAYQQLGKEFSLLVFDAQQSFKADAFAALLGTLKAGGLVILLLKNNGEKSRWLQRFIWLYQQQVSQHFFFCQQGQDLPVIALSHHSVQLAQATEEQQHAISAVTKVVTGHRKRPLVLSSDRGRGKTALLGMAAAELLKMGKQTIVVTAPSRAQVDTLFIHAFQQLDGAELKGNQLHWQQGQIQFVAPDALVAEQPKTDLLIVDEAAAIPLAMLEQMLQIYSRMVFSTTVHGYEGTGRGFSLRFTKTLDALTPNWRSVTLDKPIRWAENDQLEQFSFDALLLNAEPVDANQVADAAAEDCQFELMSQQQLSQDETLLRDMFGLMVLAHYRTRPSDLQMLLDNEDIHLAILKYQGHIVGTAWLVDEKPMSAELAEAVYQGRRKPKGHLLPQSLLLYSALSEAGMLHYQRIIRIAVHPSCQNRGLGSLLLQKITQSANCDMLGTSFALDDKLHGFWRQNAYHSVRLGHHADQVTGSVSLMMLKPISDAASSLYQQAHHKLAQQWSLLLSRSLATLKVEEVVAISQEFYQEGSEFDEAALRELESFAQHQRPFEAVDITLWQWLQLVVGSPKFLALSLVEQSVLIKRVLQQQPMQQVAKETLLKGRAELIQVCREAVSKLL